MFIDYEGDKNRIHSSGGSGDTFAEVLQRRLSRRGVVKGAAGAGLAAALAVTGPRLIPQEAQAAAPARVGALGFTPIALDSGPDAVVAEGNRALPFLRWGDPVVAGAPAFDVLNQTPSAQAQQFGYNCDWIGFLPLPAGSSASDHGLLVVNHEYTNPELMFPGYLVANPAFAAAGGLTEEPEFLAEPNQDHVDIELESHGLSVVEIERDDTGAWHVIADSPYNRRITATTAIDITGPAAGAELLKTAEDIDGLRVMGTLNNCAGGVTPWGTVISGEENFHQYFAMLGALDPENPVHANHVRYAIPEGASDRRWEEFYDRFNVEKAPSEPLRFGWGVEFDPYDPTSTPRKLTAMGRLKHEGLTSAVAPSGQVALYSGDDGKFEYAYKFISDGVFNPDDRAANRDLLDAGTLYVARFNDDGTGEWLPLVAGEGPLTAENGFAAQADVLINTRAAADLLGATKMDRPEDFETNPVTGKVYLVLTNNNDRSLDLTDRANPRSENLHGHIIELTETDNDYAGTTFAWDMFLLAGDPAQGSTWFAGFPTDQVSAFSAPDNITFDLDGNMWISTDGMPNNLPGNDGLFVVPTEGDSRGQVHQFFSSVPGAEVSGPVFTPDNSALFISIQHPGEGGSFEAPLTRWPDNSTLPPRPTVLLIDRSDAATAVAGTPVS